MAEIDAERFVARLERWHDLWLSSVKDEAGPFKGANAVCVISGARDDETVYKKSSSLHLYLLGYEFTDTILLLVKTKLFVLTSRKKAALLEPLKGKGEGKVKLTVLQRSREDNNQENFNDLLSAVRRGGTRIGILMKEQDGLLGDFAKSWLEAIERDSLQKVDIALGLSILLAQKDPQELEYAKKAALVANKVFKKALVKELEDVIDQERKDTHEQLAQKVSDAMEDLPSVDPKLTIPEGIVESCYFPIIQSGGEYDLRPNAQSSDKRLSYDIIIASMGARYRSYCGNIARTFFVDAPRKAESVYAVVLRMIDECKSKMTPGARASSVYASATKYLEERHPQLRPHLPKNVGFCIGLEFRDSNFVLNGRCQQIISAGMVFNLAVGLSDVPLSASEAKTTRGAARKLDKFSVLVADTVEVIEDGPPKTLTRFPREYGEVSYNLEAEDEEEDAEDEVVEEVAPKPLGTGATMAERLRDRSARNESNADAQKRLQTQKDLLKSNMKDLAQRRQRALAKGAGGDEEDDLDAPEIKCFADSKAYPTKMTPNQIYVDMQHECVMLPICGAHVPFHISTIKSVVQPDPEQDVTFLRINFYSGSSVTKDTPRSMAALTRQVGGTKTFIKEMLFRSLQSENLRRAHRQINELRKRVRSREAREAEEADLVEQAKLVRLKDQRSPRLGDVTLRPQLSGRKSQGHLEAHANGMRFTSTRGESLDIMYPNIRHAIMQPCKNESIVALHFNLKNPIMVGKKKHSDVQVFTEVVDASIALDSSRRRHYDPDELEEEQRLKDMKRRLDVHFKNFSAKIEKICEDQGFPVKFETPWRVLGFHGTPHKEMVFIQPTQNCLINVTEMPFFVLDLTDVEHANFERVSVTGRASAFDLTLVFNKHDELPKTIQMIDGPNLDPIQDFLTQNAITYTVTPQNLNWKQLMNSDIVKDDRFYESTDENGDAKPAGWAFLAEDEDEDAEEEDNEESEFEADPDEMEAEEEEDDEESDFADEDEDDEDEVCTRAS